MITKKHCSILLGALISATTIQAATDPLPEIQWSNASESAPALNLKKSRWYASAGITKMETDADSEEIVLSEFGAVTNLALTPGPIAGSGVAVEGSQRPSVTLGYKFARMPGLSLETVIAPPFDLTLKFTGTIRDESIAPTALNGVATGIPAFGPEFAQAKALPAVATLVYNFNPDGKFQPFIGGGFTYIYTFDHKVRNETLTENGNPKLEVDPALAGILQLGLVSRFSEKIALVTELKLASGIAIEGRMRDITLLSPTLGDVVGPTTVGLGELKMKMDASVLNISLRWDF